VIVFFDTSSPIGPPPPPFPPGKLAGLDKKLSRSLDAEVAVSCSPAELSRSPVGPLAEPAARRTLVHLILTLNHAYPDYDFGALRAHHFRKEGRGPAAVEDAVDAHLLGVARAWDATPGYGGADTPFLDALWAAIDAAAVLAECDVYSYKSEGAEADPFGEGEGEGGRKGRGDFDR
jgi:hypothetical protein